MKRAAPLLLMSMLMLCAGASQAQMYKWKDDKGVTHFSATPPPPNAKQAEVKSYNTAGAGGVELPADLAEVVRARPVVLYTAPGCAVCDQARTMLLTRGIPYREKTVTSMDDQDALKKAGSDGQLPLLLVGRSKQIGFEQGAWDTLLSDAGYPTVKSLPPGYSNPPPAPAAPPKPPSAEERAASQAAAKAAERAAEKARRERETPTNAPPNFRF